MEPYVALTLAAALLFAVGNALQKHGIERRIGPLSAGSLARPLRMLGALLRNPIWLLGGTVTLVAFGLETQALGLGDLSVVKPLSRVQTLFVLMIGVLLLGERLRGAEWLGVCVLLAGLLLLGSEPADSFTYAPGTAANLAVALGVGALAVSLLVLADRSRLGLPPEAALALAAGALFGLGDVMMKLGAEVVTARTGGFDLSRGATLPALLGTAEFPLSMLATAAAFLVQQLAFSRGRVSLVVPVIGAAGTLLAALLGFALLHEPLGAGRLTGITVVVAGTLLATGAGGPRRGLARASTNVV